MKPRKTILFLLLVLGPICCMSIFSQEPPGPPILPPPKEEIDHTAANEKLTKEIQSAIDALHPLKDAAKIELLKKIKKHIEDNKKVEPSKNLDDAIKKVVKKGEGTPQWLEDLVKGWKKTQGIKAENPNQGWKAQGQTSPIQPLQQSWTYRPIYFTEGARQVNTSYALITYTFPPHAQDVLLNARIVSADDSKNWLLQNVPVPASKERMSYRIRTDMQPFIQNDMWPEEIRLEYNIGSIQYTPGFPMQGQVTLKAYPEVEDMGGSSIGFHPLFPVMYQPPNFTIPLDADTRQRIIRSMQLLDGHLRDSLNVSLPPFNTPRVDSLLRTTRPLDIVTFSGIVQGAMPYNVSMDFLLTMLLPIDFVLRGDAVPNIDLDASKDPTDLNACVPAATANSLTWLDEQHEEIDLPGDIRETMNELKKLMVHLKEKGTEWDSMVKGKLDFIKKNNLPINVKYQAHAGAPAELKSNDPENKQTAKNKSEPDPDKPGKYYHPDFDWLMQELKDGEDVELIWGNYCDTIVKDTMWAEIEVPLGGKIRIIKEIKDRAKKTRRGGHAVNVTGAVSVGPFKWIMYKHDSQQNKSGGTEGIDNDGDATDVSQWVTDERGYTNFANRNYKDKKDDVNCTVYVDAVISESYNPPPTEKKDTPKDDDPKDNSEDDDHEEEFSNPWKNINLTTAEAKIITVAPIPVKTSSAFVPIFTGVVSTGALIYIILQDSDDPTDCSFTASALSSAPLCNLRNGAIQLNVNPAGQYYFAWSNGSITQNIEGLGAGDYSATVTKTGTTCIQVVTASLINENPEVNATIQTSPADCGMQNGSATVIPTTPGNYTFIWSTGSTDQNQSGLAAGNYNVTVNAGGTCEKSFPIVIDESPFEPTITFTTTPSSCGMNDGTIQVTVDPSAAYDYNWSGGQSGAMIANVSAGTYSVTISIPGTGCSITGETTVDELPPSFTTTVTSTPSGCGLSDGTATAIANPPGDYVYTWSNGGTGSQLSGLLPGNYSVTVSIEGTTCTQETNVTVLELPPSFTTTVTTTPSGCGLSDGTATAIVDPPGDYTYIWSNGGTGTQLTGLLPGNYTVTVSIEGTTCAQETNLTVTELPPSFTIALTSTPSGCGISDGTATVLVDPAGEYTYAWSNGGTGAQLTGLVPGDYMVTVSIPGSSCLQTASVSVGELPAAISLSFTTTPAGCGISNGSATVIVDPAGTYTYHWSNGSTDPVLSNVSPGEYSVTVTIAGSMCSNSSSVVVEQAGGGYTATFTTDNADCGVANGTATIIVEPAAEYTYAWSNQQTGPILQLVAAGTYSVVVTDTNSCTGEFSVTINQDPAEYISVINTLPGNCAGGGDITFTLYTPGVGPLNVQAVGPQGTMPISLAPGTYQLSAFIPVLPGTYTFTVYDEQIGNTCVEIVSATVQDNTPPLTVNDDFYTTPAGQALFENVLDNDSGLNIEMTAAGDVFGGAVTFNAAGDFTFIPEPGFNGDASFTYTVTDLCGNTSTGVVTILVEQVNCEFTVTFQTTPASCGLPDGMITALVSPPGSYSFIWSNGEAGPTINNIPSGPYSVTITDNNIGCDLDFTTNVAENPAEYISDIVIIQPSCTGPGEIQFTANSSTPGEMVMNVIHPNGLDIFFFDPGVIRLSDFVPITPGEYTIEVIDPEAGTDCFEFFEVTLNPVPMLQIVTEAVFPPSEPTAMDGSAIIVVIVPGTFPYTVLVDDVPYQTASSNTIQINGLGVGEYLVQIIDATGCMSNVLLVIIPFPDEPVSFGTILINLPYEQSNVEHSHLSQTSIWSTGVYADLGYRTGKSPHRIRGIFVSQSPGIYGTAHYAELNHLTKLATHTHSKFSFELEGGLGIRSDVPSAIGYDQVFASLHASTKMEFGRILHARAELSIRGWSALEAPQWGIVLMLPFIR